MALHQRPAATLSDRLPRARAGPVPDAGREYCPHTGQSAVCQSDVCPRQYCRPGNGLCSGRVVPGSCSLLEVIFMFRHFYSLSHLSLSSLYECPVIHLEALCCHRCDRFTPGITQTAPDVPVRDTAVPCPPYVTLLSLLAPDMSHCITLCRYMTLCYLVSVYDTYLVPVHDTVLPCVGI